MAGTDEFDASYSVDLIDVVGVPSGFAIQGPGDTAYVLGFDHMATTVSGDNISTITRMPIWSYYAIDLTDPTSATQVPNFPETAAYGIATVAELGASRTVTPFIATVAGDLSSGTYYDVTDPSGLSSPQQCPVLRAACSASAETGLA